MLYEDNEPNDLFEFPSYLFKDDEFIDLQALLAHLPGQPVLQAGRMNNRLEILAGDTIYRNFLPVTISDATSVDETVYDKTSISCTGLNNLGMMTGHIRLTGSGTPVWHSMLLVPYGIQGYRRGTIDAPGAPVAQGTGEYGQETVMLENADADEGHLTTRDCDSTEYVDPANDDDFVKVVLHFPLGFKPGGARLELKHSGLEVDATKTNPAQKYKATGESRVKFYNANGQPLDPATDLVIADLDDPGNGYLAGILDTGEITLFIEGLDKFGMVGNDPSNEEAAEKMGGAMLNFEFTYQGATTRQRLLVYRGGFLAVHLPATSPPLPVGGVVGSLEFWDGKGRVKHKFGGKGHEFQEDVTDWGTRIHSWEIRSGYSGGGDYNQPNKNGHTPPGWYLVTGPRSDWSNKKFTDYMTTDEGGIDYLHQGGYCRWLADDEVDPALRYTHPHRYYPSLPQDASVGNPVSNRIRFKFDMSPILPTDINGRDGIQIHPDGGQDGTAGCVGIQHYNDCSAVFSTLLNYHAIKIKVSLE